MTGYSFTQNQQDKLNKLSDFDLKVVPVESMGGQLEVIADFTKSSVRFSKITHKHKSEYEVARRTGDGYVWDTFSEFDEALKYARNMMDQEDRTV